MQRHRPPARGRAPATAARCRCRERISPRWRSRTAPPCSGSPSLPCLVDVHQDLEEEVEPEPDPEERANDEQPGRSEEHTSELQSQSNLVCRLLLEKKNQEKLRLRIV